METQHIEINQSIMINMKVNPVREGPIEDNLIKYGYISQEKRELIKTRILKKETVDCTFKPHINNELLF